MNPITSTTYQSSGAARFTSYLFGNRNAAFPVGLLYPQITIRGRAIQIISNNPPPCETVADPLAAGQSIVRPILPGDAGGVYADALAVVSLNGLRVPVVSGSLETIEQGIFVPYGQQNFRVEQEFERFQVQLLVNQVTLVMHPHTFIVIVEHQKEIQP